MLHMRPAKIALFALFALLTAACAGGRSARTTSPAPSLAPAAPPLPPMTRSPFLVGYDEAWFGDDYGRDYTSAFDLAYVNATFDGIVRAGGHVVRLWLFEGAQGVRVGVASTPRTPRTEGVSSTMLANLDQVLTAARVRGLWVYLTGLDGNETSAAGPLRTYWKSLLNDPRELDAFLRLVLAPTLAVIERHRDNLFGFDVMNELEAPIQTKVFDDPVRAPRELMRATRMFLRERAPWLRVTCSAGWDTAATDIASGLFSGVGLDFYDLHAYADSGEIANAAAVCDRARGDGVTVVLGEFGQSSPATDDALQARVTRGFLTAATGSCFEAALAWRYDDSARPASNWFNYVRRDGSFRPAASIIQQWHIP
jgi:hypothetical protein